MSDIPEEIRKMFPDQPIHKLDIDDSGELHILASAEPLNDPEFENMPIEQVNQYLREHGYDPEQVGIHGKFLQELLKRISALEAEVEALRPFRDGYDIKDKQPPTGQPIRVLTADGRTWFDYVYHPAFDNQIIDNRRIVRWWPLPEVKEQG